jgi:hypothetical protein
VNHEVSAESVVIVGHVTRRRGKAIELVEGAPPPTKRTRPLRVARTLALAHVFRELIETRVVRDQAELASLTGFTRARITQMLDLTLLAPGIQEQILTEESVAGHDRFSERTLRRVASRTRWVDQHAAWAASSGWRQTVADPHRLQLGLVDSAAGA